MNIESIHSGNVLTQSTHPGPQPRPQGISTQYIYLWEEGQPIAYFSPYPSHTCPTHLRFGTCSWINLVCQKLDCTTFPTFPKKRYWIFTTTSRYIEHLATVQHNTNFATVQNQVTLGGCSVDYEYKLLITTVGGTSCNLWLKQSQSNSLRGHTKWLKGYWILEKLVERLRKQPTEFFF